MKYIVMILLFLIQGQLVAQLLSSELERVCRIKAFNLLFDCIEDYEKECMKEKYVREYFDFPSQYPDTTEIIWLKELSKEQKSSIVKIEFANFKTEYYDLKNQKAWIIKKKHKTPTFAGFKKYLTSLTDSLCSNINEHYILETDGDDVEIYR
jgi:hypothetical protein